MTALGTRAPAARLGTTDKLLPVWIAVAMAAGLLAGRDKPEVLFVCVHNAGRRRHHDGLR